MTSSGEQLYAVAVGNTQGVWTSRKEADAQCAGHAMPLVKPCKSRDEADAFVALFRGPDPVVVVYVDGACSSNGRSGARAGVGVFWGTDDVRNVSRPVRGLHTNNVAELEAAGDAFRAIARDKDFLTTRYCVVTDSQYVLNILTKWYKAWEGRGWVGSAGGPIKNLPLIHDVYAAYECVKERTNVAHVRGHAGIPGNEHADKLACQGALA